MNSPNDREVAVFGAARNLPAEARAAYLDEACAGDAALRQCVEELLRAGEQAGAFLQRPAPGAQRPGEASAPPNSPPEGVAGEKAGDRIGRYKLLERIGEGGCGVVYMAEQEEPVQRRVALKIIKLGMDTRQVIARFEAERQALALMDHPNIAQVFDAGATESGRPYFVMELVRGIKITYFCDKNNVSTEERLKLFIQVCHAIQHAHQKGIIHRDIKPSNILVTINDPGSLGCPKVIDFGVAKATAGRLTDHTLYTAFEQFIGTPAYMSPEQAVMTSLEVDTRSDIYSLGVLLYELLAGRTPFDGQRLLQAGREGIREVLQQEEPPRPSTRLSTLDAKEQTSVAKHRQTEPPRLISLIRGDLDWIAMKALEKDRARRYETANALAMDVERHLKHEPVVARPPSATYRLGKLVRRNRLTFAAGSAVILALVIGLSAATAMFLRERAARQQLIAAEREQAVERAMVAATGGDFDALQRALEDAEGRGVPDARLRMLRGIHFYFSGRSLEAIEPLQQAVQGMPQSVAARALLASAYIVNDWQCYEEQVGLLRPLQPATWEDYLFKGEALSWVDPGLELPLMDKAVELKRNSPLARLVRAHARTDQAVNIHDLAMLQSALEDLEAARQFVPRDNLLLISGLVRTHLHAALLCEEARRPADQEQHLRQAEIWGKQLEQLPQCAAAMAQRIVQMEVCGREAEAFDYMQRILRQQHCPPVLRLYGDALYRRGQVQEAYDAYASRGKVSPPHEYMRLIARIELSGAREQVKAELDQFFAKYSGGTVELAAPSLYRLAGLMEEAERRGRAIYQHLPRRVSSFGAHFGRIAQFNAGLLDEAALIAASRDSARNLCQVYNTVGIRHLAQADRAGAREYFEKSLQTGTYEYVQYDLANNLLARLKQDPNWPPWIPLKPPAVAGRGDTSKQ